ncbi:hypothetical protein OROGR_030334 [Orobanche gracilis]
MGISSSRVFSHPQFSLSLSSRVHGSLIPHLSSSPSPATTGNLGDDGDADRSADNMARPWSEKLGSGRGKSRKSTRWVGISGDNWRSTAARDCRSYGLVGTFGRDNVANLVELFRPFFRQGGGASFLHSLRPWIPMTGDGC